MLSRQTRNETIEGMVAAQRENETRMARFKRGELEQVSLEGTEREEKLHECFSEWPARHSYLYLVPGSWPVGCTFGLCFVGRYCMLLVRKQMHHVFVCIYMEAC